MSHRLLVVLSLMGMSVVDLGNQLPSAVVSAGESYAFLVGVGNYDEKELSPLPFARPDVMEFRDALIEGGFKSEHIVLMVDDLTALPKTNPVGRFLPEADKIRKELALLIPSLEADDSLVIALCGHGVQFKGENESYFCPSNAELANRKTLISLSSLYDQLKYDKQTQQGCKARQRLLIVDACRNDPRTRIARSAGAPELESVTRPQLAPLPEGVVALFSCAEGQQALEHPPLKHGVFFYHVLEAWKGRADDGDRQLTLDEMIAFTKSKTQTYARVNLGAAQSPRQNGFFDGTWVLRSLKEPLPDVNEILDKALLSAYSITDEQQRAACLLRIAGAQAIRQTFRDALRTASQIGDASTKGSALNLIAVAQVKAGDSPAAMNTARLISHKAELSAGLFGPTLPLRIVAMTNIAQQQIEADDMKVARSTLTEALHEARAIAPESGKSWLLRQIAILQADAGDLTSALETSRSIGNEFNRNALFGPVGSLSDKLIALNQVAIVHAKHGHKETAKQIILDELQLTRLIGRTERSSWMSEIAFAQAEVGDYQSAQRTLEESVADTRLISDAVKRANWLNNVANAQAKIKDVDAARSTRLEAVSIVHALRSTDNPFYKANTLIDIALGQAKDGNKSEARVTFDTVIREARSLSDASDRRSILGNIIRAQIEAVDLSAALQLARSIEDVETKVSALKMIADAQAKDGDLQQAKATSDEAFKIAPAANDDETVSSGLSELAEKCASAGDFVSALEATRRMKDKNWAVHTLAGIAVAQANAGGTDAAKATIAEAVNVTTSLMKEGNDESIFVACSWVAIAQAAIGLGSEAIVTVRDDLVPRWPKAGIIREYTEPYVAKFCVAQLKNGCVTQVVNLTGSVPNLKDQVLILVCVLEAILEQQKSVAPGK